MIKYDDDNDIALFKIYKYLGQLLDSALTDNEMYKIIFHETGISSLIDNYSIQLSPFRYNGHWQNENPQYNPIGTFYELYLELDDKHRFLFIKSIVEKIPYRYFDKEKISNHLLILGYSVVSESSARSNYTISQTEAGLVERENDIPLLESKIRDEFPQAYRFYDEALSTFGNGEYKSCIDNCRSLFESITKDLSAESSVDKSLLNITKESILDNNNAPITSKDKIYDYWIKNRKGANRYRYFTTLYSIMSGLGTHGEDTPTKKDAVMILRAMEDVLVWILL